ncbi:MAG: 50S ribosomal protein L25 [Pirellulales bacterium]|jgi:large subunit ribosomal protein L25|nr:50S ribosomal protein L25 [Pirellulales bacterium]
MAETLEVYERESRGKRNARRSRAAGRIPAILYGHGGPSISLSVDSNKLTAVVNRAAHLVALSGAVQENALFRDIQWDPLGNDILHVDFTRVDEKERIEVAVAIELRGVAPGTKMGGIINQQMHELSVECPAMAIPDKLEINVNTLELGESILASSIDLAKGVNLLCDPQTTIVQCVEPMPEEDDEDEAIVDGAIEPEVIGRKTDEEETEAAS